MRQDPYKKRIFMEWLIPKVVGAAIGLVVILLVIIMASMNESTVLLNEGTAKSMPLLSNEKIRMLGDLYVRLNINFEKEIKDMELNYANRYNKRGDKIYYGVNGKENIDDMVNDDYVNGIESITYVKGNAKNRHDGESNFIDMMAFLSTALGSDMDRYSDEQLKALFTNLFALTHTFTGTSTELYPCNHGCAWCKYYCGDYRCQGTLNGNTVGYYQSDLYMGKDGEYGLMYDPFLIDKQSNYQYLKDLAGDPSANKTTYQYKTIGTRVVSSGDEIRVVREIKIVGDTVVAEDDEIYELAEPKGFCPVCTNGRVTFNSTTRKFGGCITHVSCHHGETYHIPSEDADVPGTDVDWYMGRDRRNCDNPYAESKCSHEHSDSCEWSESELEAMEEEPSGCKHEVNDCLPEDIGCEGYYVCSEGHEHYACPGHIIVCCFGHTNLKLEIKIMYYEEMIDTLKDIID